MDFITTKENEPLRYIAEVIAKTALHAGCGTIPCCAKELVDDDGHGQRHEMAMRLDYGIPLWIYPTMYRGETSFMVQTAYIGAYDVPGVGRGYENLQDAVDSAFIALVALRLIYAKR